MLPLHKVLVVDDDPVIGRSFDRVLSDRGYAVIAAANGQEALDRMAREDYDMVFTDIRMPGMDGIDVAARIKARQPWMPVVIVTGYGTAEAQARAREVGVSGFLHKPLSSDAIEACAREVLEASASAAATIEALAGAAKARLWPAAAPALPAAAPVTDLATAALLAASEPPTLAWPVVRAKVGRFLRDVGLFFAAPFIGLVYVVLFPFVGLGALVWLGIGAVLKRKQVP